jgi:hypothetical protein
VRVFAPQIAYQGKTWLQAEAFFAPLGQDGQVFMLLAAIDVWPRDQV